MRFRLIAAGILVAGSLGAADPGLLNLAVPNARLIGGWNIEHLRLSPLGQYLLALSAKQPDPDLQKLSATTGFDPFRDLREIIFTSDGQPNGGRTLITARGAFDVPRILEAAQAGGKTIDTYKGVEIVNQSKKEALAFPDSTLALFGEPADVEAAIDRKSAPSALSAVLASQVKQLSATQDAWFASVVPGSALLPTPSGGGKPAGAFGAIANVQQASGSVTCGANIVVAVDAVSTTSQDAAAVADIVRLLTASVAGVKSTPGSELGLLRSIVATTDGNVTKLSLNIPEDTVEQFIKTGWESQHHPHGKTQSKPKP